MDKTNNTKYAAQQIAEIIHGSHSWVPTRTTDPDTQHEITQLRNQLAELRQRAGEDTGDTSTPAKTGPSASSPSTTPIQRALMNSTCPAPPTPTFDPSTFQPVGLPFHGQSMVNPTHANNYNLGCTSLRQMAQRTPIVRTQAESAHRQHCQNRNVVWSHQPSDALETVERVAVMMGITVALLGKTMMCSTSYEP